VNGEERELDWALTPKKEEKKRHGPVMGKRKEKKA